MSHLESYRRLFFSNPRHENDLSIMRHSKTELQRFVNTLDVKLYTNISKTNCMISNQKKAILKSEFITRKMSKSNRCITLYSFWLIALVKKAGMLTSKWVHYWGLNPFKCFLYSTTSSCDSWPINFSEITSLSMRYTRQADLNQPLQSSNKEQQHHMIMLRDLCKECTNHTWKKL